VLSGAQAQDVRVVGLTVEPFTTADAAKHATRIGMRFPVGVADEALLSRFRVQSVPTTYVIDKHGKIVLSRVGAIAKRELDAAIAAARDAT
jgi:thioredoxin-related protein